MVGLRQTAVNSAAASEASIFGSICPCIDAVLTDMTYVRCRVVMHVYVWCPFGDAYVCAGPVCMCMFARPGVSVRLFMRARVGLG